VTSASAASLWQVKGRRDKGPPYAQVGRYCTSRSVSSAYATDGLPIISRRRSAGFVVTRDAGFDWFAALLCQYRDRAPH
jgi:hypothetical protein